MAALDLARLQPRRIVLIKPSALGDVLNGLPVLSALRQLYPKAHLSWLVNRSYAPLLEGHPDLDEVITFERASRRWWLGPVAFTRFMRSLRDRTFDLAIDLQGLLRSGLMTWGTGAPCRIGLQSAREGARWFYTHQVLDDRLTQHAVDRCWAVVEALGGGDLPKTFRLAVGEEERRWARELMANYPRPWLTLAVGARWLTKRWPPEFFAKLASQAQERFGGSVIFIGAAEEMELSMQAGRSLSGPVCDQTGRTSLTQLTALLAQADVVLANDTGPLHLAVALGRPIVAPYTCTQVRRNGPYGQETRAVETRVWCQGSYQRRCNRLECMAELTPDRLWPILHDVLAASERKRQCA